MERFILSFTAIQPQIAYQIPLKSVQIRELYLQRIELCTFYASQTSGSRLKSELKSELKEAIFDIGKRSILILE